MCQTCTHIFKSHATTLENNEAERIHLTYEFKKDWRWFDKFLGKYNDTSFYDHHPAHHVLELDACLTGLGGRCDKVVYHVPIPKHYKNLAIVHLEMINILVAVCLYKVANMY